MREEDLATIHEKRGDDFVRQAERAPLEPAAQRLEHALTQYQDAQVLQPQDALVRAKVQKKPPPPPGQFKSEPLAKKAKDY